MSPNSTIQQRSVVRRQTLAWRGGVLFSSVSSTMTRQIFIYLNFISTALHDVTGVAQLGSWNNFLNCSKQLLFDIGIELRWTLGACHLKCIRGPYTLNRSERLKLHIKEVNNLLTDHSVHSNIISVDYLSWTMKSNIGFIKPVGIVCNGYHHREYIITPCLSSVSSCASALALTHALAVTSSIDSVAF